jgi:hypothetical protein
VNVTCQSSTVDAKNPMRSPLQPPITKQMTPSVQGPIQSCLSMKRSSGYFAKSRIWFRSASLYASQRIQPTWLHQNPRLGECTSRSVSEKR